MQNGLTPILKGILQEGITVLVAEQYLPWQGLVQRAIEGTFGEGTVIAAATYEEALNAAKGHTINAYVLSGTAFKNNEAEVKRLVQAGGSPVYVLSALDITVREAQRCGLKAYDKTEGNVINELIAQMQSDLQLDH